MNVLKSLQKESQRLDCEPLPVTDFFLQGILGVGVSRAH